MFHSHLQYLNTLKRKMKILARTLVEIDLAYNQDEEDKDDDDRICE